MLVTGDYNQAIPRCRAPQHVSNALLAAIPPHLRYATEWAIPPLGVTAIDHVSHSDSLEVALVRGLSNFGPSERELSDHFGLHLQMRQS